MTTVPGDFSPQAGRDLPTGEVSAAQNNADVEDVATAVHGLAGLVSDVDDLDGALAQIAAFAVLAIPGAAGAGATLTRTGDGTTDALAWAVTDPFVREIDHLQYDICREGPCVTAMQTARSVVSGSLGTDVRWPRFGARVARLNVHSALSLPLLVRGSVVGALNVYAHQPDAFGEHAVHLAGQFAGPAAVTVHNIQVLRAAHVRATQLQAALVSRSTIDQAIGIIRSRSGGSAEEGFDRLRTLSQSENVKVAVIAQRIVDEAVRRVGARRSEA